jgi:hypothetical protein
MASTTAGSSTGVGIKRFPFVSSISASIAVCRHNLTGGEHETADLCRHTPEREDRMSESRTVRRDDRLRAAAFMQEALGADMDPLSLEPGLDVVSTDTYAITYTVELESSIGDAAFLIYQFSLTATGPDGRTGADVFREGLETLELATERNTPGPRLLAHGTTEDEGYMLATTPATYRLLTGAGDLDDITASDGDLLPGADTSNARRQSSDELLRLLKLANDQAKTWFAAVRAEGRVTTSGADLPLSQEEQALALFLLDESSIQDLLRLLAVMVDTAKRQHSEQ